MGCFAFSLLLRLGIGISRSLDTVFLVENFGSAGLRITLHCIALRCVAYTHRREWERVHGYLRVRDLSVLGCIVCITTCK